MIIAYYAVGPKGEFGFENKLPWGSFPEELQALRTVLVNHAPRVILVGMATWVNLPQSFKDFIKKDLNNPAIMVYAKRHSTTLQFAKDNPNISVVLDISLEFVDWAKNVDVAVLGGAKLLAKCYDSAILDGAVISYVTAADGEGFSADSYLPEEAYASEHQPAASVFLQDSGTSTAIGKRVLNFVQEYHYFGTV